MKTPFYAFLVLPLIFTIPSHAEDVLVLDKADNSIVSGTITRVQGDSIFVSSSGRDVEVDLDELDIEKQVSDLFAPGMQITAKGRLEDVGHTPRLEAKEIIRSDAGAIANTEVLLLNDDDND